jgi:uncharacterized RmlC-like cupin family protein
MVTVPASIPHLPRSQGPDPVTAAIARTDPHEQDSVVLCPELDALMP